MWGIFLSRFCQMYWPEHIDRPTRRMSVSNGQNHATRNRPMHRAPPTPAHTPPYSRTTCRGQNCYYSRDKICFLPTSHFCWVHPIFVYVFWHLWHCPGDSNEHGISPNICPYLPNCTGYDWLCWNLQDNFHFDPFLLFGVFYVHVFGGMVKKDMVARFFVIKEWTFTCLISAARCHCLSRLACFF